MQKEAYNRLSNERIAGILEMSREIDYNNLTCHFKGSTSPISFIKFKDSFGFFNQIKSDNISLIKTEEEQNKFKSILGEITSRNPKHKEKYKLDTIKNAKNLYDSRQKIFSLFNDSVKIRSEAIHKTKHDQTKQRAAGRKILTTKQMLQRLPIALAQVKAGNNSESLVNEIRQIVYFLYQSKEITKKVNNNIIISTQ